MASGMLPMVGIDVLRCTSVGRATEKARLAYLLIPVVVGTRQIGKA